MLTLIRELPFYPLNYYVDSALKKSADGELSLEAWNSRSVAKLTEKLVKRGKRFVELCTAAKGKQLFKYAGDAYFHIGRSLRPARSFY